MNAISFLVEWALRSSILILGGALLLWALRVKDASIRLAAWTAILCGSLLIPAMTTALPVVPVCVARPAILPTNFPITFEDIGPVESSAIAVGPAAQPKTAPINWLRVAIVLYIAVALAMLLRLCLGLAMSYRFLRRSRATGKRSIRESDRVNAPVTLGIICPVIILPSDWREWETVKLEAVLAHERSHIGRYDPAVQLLSSLHRALLWFSPLSWALHTRIARVAEEASDDAAVAATGDRVTYAKILLDFVRRARPHTNLAGVSMARYGSPDKRIHRILDATSLSRGVTRWSVVTMLALGMPLAYLVASVRPQDIPARTIAAVQTASSAPVVIQVRVPEAPRVVAQTALPPKAQPAVAVAKPKFEVTSVRPNKSPDLSKALMQFLPGGRFVATNIPLIQVIAVAWDLSMQSQRLTLAPGVRMPDDIYDIEATAEKGALPAGLAPMERFSRTKLMLQALLEDRFQLKIRREPREEPVYALVTGKGGPKLEKSKFQERDCDDTVANWISNPACHFLDGGQGRGLHGASVTIAQVVEGVQDYTDRPLFDKTGLTGYYNIQTEGWAPMRANPATLDGASQSGDSAVNHSERPTLSDVFGNLGLQMESQRAVIDMFVIDQVERPSEN